MERQDFLKRQLDEMARFFASLLASWSGLSGPDAIQQNKASIDEAFVELLGLSLTDIIGLKPEGFLDFMQTQQLSPADADALALLLQKMAQDLEDTAYLDKALLAYRYATDHDQNYSLDRQARIERLERRLG